MVATVFVLVVDVLNVDELVHAVLAARLIIRTAADTTRSLALLRIIVVITTIYVCMSRSSSSSFFFFFFFFFFCVLCSLYELRGKFAFSFLLLGFVSPEILFCGVVIVSTFILHAFFTSRERKEGKGKAQRWRDVDSPPSDGDGPWPCMSGGGGGMLVGCE